MNINFILGSGFSVSASFPTVNQLNEKFLNIPSLGFQLYREGFFKWNRPEQSEINRPDRLKSIFYNLLMTQLIEQFQFETKRDFDYETFYSWLLCQIFSDNYLKFEKIICKVVDNCKDPIDFATDPTNCHIVLIKAINYLIEDELNKDIIITSVYNEFIELIKKSNQCNIFTLNHDRLIDEILIRNRFVYSDGFDANKSQLIGANNQPLPIFSNNFSSNINLFKLHGSIDYYQFEIGVENPSYQLNRNGESLYFKTMNFPDTIHAKRIDHRSNIVVQNFAPVWFPKFITGTSKEREIESVNIFNSLFHKFMIPFNELDYLIIIGYSYKDEHINSIIERNIDMYKFKVININPDKNVPFENRLSTDSLIKLDFIDQISQLNY